MTPFTSAAKRRAPGDPALRARDERLESLKAVVGKLAHDFNNFLVPQFGYLTLLKEESLAESTGGQYAAAMESAGRKTAAYIESILLGMRPHRQFAPKQFRLDEMVREALRDWQVATPKGTGIQVRSTLEECSLCGDERHWKNAVEHLLSNARYGLATGGELDVTLQPCTVAGDEIERLGLQQAEHFRLTVRDSGFGMPPAVAARAFEPFFTTRSQIKAAGLGLTIVHSVAQFHGGQVELETAEDHGTAVVVWIPAAGMPGRDRLASVGGTLQAGRQKRKVLLLEPDPLIKEVLREWLTGFDLDVQTAGNPGEAERLLKRRPEGWVLAISESNLEGTSGESVCAASRQIVPGLPWLLLAGPGQRALGDEGPWSVLTKPVKRSDFVEVVRRHADA